MGDPLPEESSAAYTLIPLERERRLQYAVSSVLIALGALATLFFLIPGVTGAPVLSTLITVGLTASFAFSRLLARRDRVRAASALLLTSLLFGSAITVICFSGLDGASMMLLSVTVLFAGLLRGWRAAAIMAGVAGGFVLLLLGLELTGNHPPPIAPTSPLTQAFLHLIAISLVAVFLGISIRQLDRAVSTAAQHAKVARRSEALLAQLIIDSPDGILQISSDGLLLDANPRACDLSGRPRDELIGKSAVDVLGLADESAERLTTRLEAALSESKSQLLELDLEHEDGTLRVIEANITTLRREKEAPCLQVVARDISARRIAERERAEYQKKLREVRRLESIGRLAGGIAHDFNNLLTVVMGHSELISRDATLPKKTRKRSVQILETSARSASLIKQLLAFARQQMLEPKVIDLNKVIVGLDELLSKLITEQIELHIVPSETVALVRADSTQIEQVLFNLAANARAAMPNGGVLTIETQHVTFDEEPISGDLAPGRYVRLNISDTGIGMSAETLDRVFEPFFSTRSAQGGTGLGLATVHGIVKQSGGHIKVASELDEGTTFEILFPAIEGETHNQEPHRPDRVSKMPPLTALVVDDEQPLRDSASEALEAKGMHVLSASDGVEALELIKGREAAIDLLVTDVVMPKMGGRELARMLAEHSPNLRVLFMSGYAEDVMAEDGSLEEGIHFLAKPFTPSVLLAKLRSMLE